MTTSSQPPTASPGSAAATVNKGALIIGGIGLVAIGALAAVLLQGSPAPRAEPALVQAPAPALVAAAPTVPAPAVPTPAVPAPSGEPTAAAKPVAATQAPAAKAVEASLPTEAAPGARAEAAAPARAPATVPAPKPVCTQCGVVSAVTPVQKKGEAGALGTVAGGVVGGVIGHQMGGGSGKTAMTVIGTVGGAMAGREVEKRHGTTTEYELRIRMNDGSTRTFTRSEAMAVGQRVRVNGDQLTIDSAPTSGR